MYRWSTALMKENWPKLSQKFGEKMCTDKGQQFNPVEVQTTGPLSVLINHGKSMQEGTHTPALLLID